MWHSFARTTFRLPVLIGLLAASCAPTEPAKAPIHATKAPAKQMPSPAVVAWQSPNMREHPLVGSVVDVGRGALSSEDDLTHALRSARYVLIGERHDNPDHHVLQARLVRKTLEGRLAPVLALEMFDLRDQPAIDAYFAGSPSTAAGLGDAVRWDEKGWPGWPMYLPIVQAGVDHGASIVAANLPRPDVMAAARSSEVTVGAERMAVPSIPEDMKEALEQEMFDAHCGHVPRDKVGMMVVAQVARDAVMARRMTMTLAGDVVVLIAGNGHVRRDRGVPWHVRQQGAEGGIVSVGMAEVRPSWREAGDVVREHGTEFDFVWVTPEWDRSDPCAEMTGR